MKKTIAVIVFFVAALLAGLFLSGSPAPAKASMEDNQGSKETFAQRQVGMPLDMEAAEGVTGYSAASPILGSEPKPTPERPYDMANDQELFQFKNNKISPECCPSPFSRDGGCVCLTDADRKLFMSRGGNN